MNQKQNETSGPLTPELEFEALCRSWSRILFQIEEQIDVLSAHRACWSARGLLLSKAQVHASAQRIKSVAFKEEVE